MIMAAELAAEKARSDRLAAELAGVLDRIAALPVTADGNTGPLPRFPARAGAGRGTRRAGARPRFRLIKGGLAAFLPLAALKHASRAHRIAAAAAALTSTAAVGGALVVTVPGITHAPAGPSGGTYSTVPGWHTSAVPLPDPTLIAKVTHPQTLSRGARRDRQSLTPLPPAASPPPSSPSASQPSAGASSSSAAPAATGGPAALQVPIDAIDLSSTPQAMITLTATGDSGWVSWHISTSGSDLDFSSSHGVLRAGQTVEITVSLDATQDGNATQEFTINGQPVTVTLPAPVVAPTDAATDTASPAPTVEVPSPISS